MLLNLRFKFETQQYTHWEPTKKGTNSKMTASDRGAQRFRATVVAAMVVMSTQVSFLTGCGVDIDIDSVKEQQLTYTCSDGNYSTTVPWHANFNLVRVEGWESIQRLARADGGFADISRMECVADRNSNRRRFDRHGSTGPSFPEVEVAPRVPDERAAKERVENLLQMNPDIPDVKKKAATKAIAPWEWEQCLAKTPAGFFKDPAVTELGNGAFGEVLPHAYDGHPFVEKVFYDLSSEGAVKPQPTAQQEAEFMNRAYTLMGDYALPCLKVESDGKAATLLMPRLLGSLSSFLLKGTIHFTPLQSAVLIADLARFLFGLQRAGIFHGDYHGGNILITYAHGAFRAKLADFGIAGNLPVPTGEDTDGGKARALLAQRQLLNCPEVNDHPFFDLFPPPPTTGSRTESIDGPDPQVAYKAALQWVFDEVLKKVGAVECPEKARVEAWALFFQVTRPPLDESFPVPPAGMMQCMDMPVKDVDPAFTESALEGHFRAMWGARVAQRDA